MGGKKKVAQGEIKKRGKLGRGGNREGPPFSKFAFRETLKPNRQALLWDHLRKRTGGELELRGKHNTEKVFSGRNRERKKPNRTSRDKDVDGGKLGGILFRTKKIWGSISLFSKKSHLRGRTGSKD